MLIKLHCLNRSRAMSVVSGFFNTLAKVEGAALCACLSSGATVGKETNDQTFEEFCKQKKFLVSKKRRLALRGVQLWKTADGNYVLCHSLCHFPTLISPPSFSPAPFLSHFTASLFFLFQCYNLSPHKSILVKRKFPVLCLKSPISRSEPVLAGISQTWINGLAK